MFWLGALEFKILKFLFSCCLYIFLGNFPRFSVQNLQISWRNISRTFKRIYKLSHNTKAQIWKKFWVENSTQLRSLPIPSSAETWRIFGNMLCQFFFAQVDILSEKTRYFWKASFVISARKTKHFGATTMFTYSHSNTPSRLIRARVLSYKYERGLVFKKGNFALYQRLCLKVGRGQGDGDIGTRVWGLGTWGRVTRDLRKSSMGRGDVWDGDEGTSNAGTQGMWNVNDYCKSRK